MRQPDTWEPTYRLNTCLVEDCGHYLHDGQCRVPSCNCQDGIGRWATFYATEARTKTCWHGVRPSTSCKICENLRKSKYPK